jgi:hypothetical protein
VLLALLALPGVGLIVIAGETWLAGAGQPPRRRQGSDPGLPEAICRAGGWKRGYGCRVCEILVWTRARFLSCNELVAAVRGLRRLR